MKKTMIAITAAVSIFALSACNSNGKDSDVLVETSAGNISKDDLYNAMKDQAGKDILKDLVYVKVLSEKYKVSDKEIDKKMEETFGAQLDQYIAQYGKETVRDVTKSNILKEKAAKDSIKVKDGEVIRASHILIQAPKESATKEELAKAEATAKEIKAKLDKGESFEELAKEYGSDGTAANGGDLGWFTKESMVKEFSDAAFAMKKDEISGPVQSDFGYHIIKVTDIADNFDKMDDAKKDEILNALLKSNPTAVTDALDKAVKDAKVEVKEKDFKDLFEEPKTEE
ncbi:peptidylprolyl isomerase [Ferdinandcohnia quinoae]|uniref:Foldase protein PrsA n=1 Tax=Fredinandcohnia quinoae TaxID=2918902 RepID=A0AAW5E1M0_9BACI|nr:peptidylprolyl isomerase [Fredinandcohnia sp. SECRCQ15]MCH1626805.1 peptidylprolyl isomerase [Fredinandcohnia sp. SECRCQ15]